MEQVNSGVESIFATLGSVFDGAQSILGDWLEYDLLKSEVEAQSAGNTGSSNYGQPTAQVQYLSTPTGGNSKLAVYGLLGAAVLIGVVALKG
ncbi:MAG: hypothetical protein JKY93_03150 [Gammaproteobacteria bacterium]|nr:hypothetical protein [Gammaproteobacteria bacterium]